MTYSYYPGCSLHAGGVAYDESLRAVFARLGVDLAELEDWNCCGATAYMSVRKTVAYAISARNLSLAARAGHELVAPCSACFMVLNKTKTYLGEMPELRANVSAALGEAGLECRLDVEVRHPLDVLVRDVGIERIRRARTHSLDGFRPACYYGCQIVRPHSALEDDDAENPMAMERLLEALGASPVDYPPKVTCCGGSAVITYEPVARTLSQRLVDWALERGANCIVTVCPLCQTNLDVLTLDTSARNGSEAIPILYFTQLVGLALGCSPAELGIQRGLRPLRLEARPAPAAGVAAAPSAPAVAASAGEA